MAVESIAWSPTSIRLNRTNNYQNVSTYTVTFDDNFSGEFTVEIYVSGVNTITLTRYGNGTDTYTEEFLVRAEDWFTSYNYYSDNESLLIRIGGVVASRGLSVTLENAPPVVDSLTIRSSWSDPTVFVQGVTSITITAQISPLFGAEIDSAEVELLGLTNYIEMENVGGVWTATIPSSSVSDSGSFTPIIQTLDSRGLRGHNSFTQNRVKVLEHSAPTVSVEAFRCDSNGDFDLGGGYISVTAWANSNPSILGLEYLHIYLQNLDATQVWTEYNAQSGTTYILGADAVDPDEGYILQVTAEDNYDLSTMKPYGISAVNRIINVKDGGTGVAFGKLATEDALLDSAWDINTDGEYLVQGQPLVDTLPDADTTTRGLVSTGAQNFGGNKTFNGIAKFRSSEGTPEIHFVSKSNDPADYNGIMYLATPLTGSNRRTDRFIFRGMSYNSSTGARLTNYENYQLPSVDADRTSNATYNILTSKSPVTIAQGGTGQTGQTAQQSYTPTVKIGTTAQTVSSLSAYYKSWGLMKLIGGRFNLTTTGTGQLVISLPTGFTVPTSAVQPMGVLIAPDQKVYHIRVAAEGLAAMSNGGGSVAWTTGYYCFWAVVMGN